MNIDFEGLLGPRCPQSTRQAHLSRFHRVSDVKVLLGGAQVLVWVSLCRDQSRPAFLLMSEFSYSGVL